MWTYNFIWIFYFHLLRSPISQILFWLSEYYTNHRIEFHLAVVHFYNSILLPMVLVCTHMNNSRHYIRLLMWYYLMVAEHAINGTEKKLQILQYQPFWLNERIECLLTTVFGIFVIDTVEISITEFFGINAYSTFATGSSTLALIWQTFPFQMAQWFIFVRCVERTTIVVSVTGPLPRYATLAT